MSEPSMAYQRTTGEARNNLEFTIAERLAAKAEVADRCDYAGQRSLGEMSREELRQHLFGDE